MIPTIKYALTTAKHKWFVLIAGFRTKAKLYDLLIHDLSKFSPSELSYYGRQFFGDKGDPEGFARCWLHHQNCNKHHIEYWVQRSNIKSEKLEPLEMPERYVREMIADWLGASRAYNGQWPKKDNWVWYSKNGSRLNVHPKTKDLIIKILSTELNLIDPQQDQPQVPIHTNQ